MDSVSLLGKRSSDFKRSRQKDKVLSVKVSHDDFYNRMGPMFLLNKPLSIRENTPEKDEIFSPEIEEPKIEAPEVETPEVESLDDSPVIPAPVSNFENISDKSDNLLIMTNNEKEVEDEGKKVKSDWPTIIEGLTSIEKVEAKIQKEVNEAPEQIETVPDTVFVSNRFELNKTSFVWRQSRQSLLELDTFSNLENRVVNQHALKTRKLYDPALHRRLRDVNFQVSSRTSSFQVRVTDTERIRELARFFFDLWRKRKRARRKPESWQSNENERMCKVARSAPKPPWRVPCCYTRITSRFGYCLDVSL